MNIIIQVGPWQSLKHRTHLTLCRYYILVPRRSIFEYIHSHFMFMTSSFKSSQRTWSSLQQTVLTADGLHTPLPKAPESSSGPFLSGGYSLDTIEKCFLSRQPHNAVCTRTGREGIANMNALVALVVGRVLWIPAPNNNFL